MLPRTHRLSLRTEFKKIKLEGRLIQGKFFSLLLRVRQDNQPSRFAFIVSKKVHPLSSQRNRVRRLLSEAVYSLLSKYETNLDGVFLVRQLILGKTLTEIKNEVKKIFPPVN